VPIENGPLFNWARYRKVRIVEGLRENGFREIDIVDSRDDVSRDRNIIVAIESNYIIKIKHHISISHLTSILIGVNFIFDENEKARSKVDIKEFQLKDTSKKNYLKIRRVLEDKLHGYEQDIKEILSIIGYMA